MAAKKKSATPPGGDSHNLFIAWAGPRSRRVAETLASWLSLVIDAARPWMSEQNLRSGTTWFTEIMRQLQSVQAGIVCVTPGNKTNHWIHFEAGAIASRVRDQALVMPYLIGFKKPSDLLPPMSLLHARMATEEQTLKLVLDVNDAIGRTVAPEALKKKFAMFWPELEKVLNEPEPKGEPESSERGVQEMVEEMLGMLRSVGADVSRAVQLSTDANYRSMGFVPPSADGERPLPSAATALAAAYRSGVPSSAGRPSIAEMIRRSQVLLAELEAQKNNPG